MTGVRKLNARLDASPDASSDALIIGGGPAGAALAIALARNGRTVQLIEQSAAAHHKVCGEFLSHEAVAYLDRLGLDPRALGAAPIHSVRLAARRQIAACDLPFPALSLTRCRLDEALLTLVVDAGASVMRGRRVGKLGTESSKNVWRAQLCDGEARTAPAVFLATGKHDLAGHRRPPGKQNDLIAFKMYFYLAPAQQRALEGWVELYLFPGGYAGLELVEESQANLCFVINRQTLRTCGHQWPALLDHLLRHSDLLAMRLDGAQPLLAKPLALSFIPYGLLIPRAQPGLWRLGDQAAVISSFSGDGMSIALHSAHLAADLFTRGAISSAFASQLCAELHNSVRLATTISRLVISAPALAQLTRLWPPILRHLAAHTRIPDRALHNLIQNEIQDESSQPRPRRSRVTMQ